MTSASTLNRADLGVVLKTALDAVVVMRRDGTVIAWNDVAENTFGWSHAEAIGRRMSALIIPERHRARHESGLARYLATGKARVLDQRLEIQALHKDGHEIPVELSITLTDQFGEPVFLGFLRDITERHDAARRQELMIGELNHRVKNLLGVVAGIAQQTARSSTDIQGFNHAFAGRLSSLGRAHEILTAATWERASLRTLVDELFGAFAQGVAPQVRVGGPDVLLAPRAFLSLSMIFHELLTNAIKYGALSRSEGCITLNWSLDGQHLSLQWNEHGAPCIEVPERRGFGTRMIAMNVRHDLAGQAETEWHEDGMRFRLDFSLDAAS